MSQPNTVTVKILDKEYQVACPEDQEDNLATSAKYLDKQMRKIRETGKVIGVERIAVMAAQLLFVVRRDRHEGVSRHTADRAALEPDGSRWRFPYCIRLSG